MVNSSLNQIESEYFYIEIYLIQLAYVFIKAYP